MNDDNASWWWPGANCRRPDADPDRWFPNASTRRGINLARADAKALCDGCGYVCVCACKALTQAGLTGIWAGEYVPAKSCDSRREALVRLRQLAGVQR